MPTRPFAILEHTMPDASVHHDLLIDRPGGENGVGYRFPADEKTVSDTVSEDDTVSGDGDATTLWAVRIDPPPGDWAKLGRLVLTLLPPHRRRYLTYEGPISRGRGSVRRLAQGDCEVRDDARGTTIAFTIAGYPLSLTLTTDAQGRLVAHVD